MNVEEVRLLINKIDIESFGPYKNYEWQKNIPESEICFKAINIFYGRNYAGKTSLSRIFHSLEKQELQQEYKESKFMISTSSGSTFNEKQLNDIPYTFKVYNSDYVKENLSFFNNDEEDIKAFAVIGEANIKVQKEIDILKSELGLSNSDGLIQNLEVIAESKNTILKEFKAKSNDIEDALRARARDIKNAARIYNRTTYNIASIKSDIERLLKERSSLLNSLSEEEQENLIKIINEQPKKVPELNFAFNSQRLIHIIKQINELLMKKIKPTQQLEKLINDAILQEWVRQGKDIHKEKGVQKTCLFCNSPIKEDLWKQISDHFSVDSDVLRSNLISFQKELNQLKELHRNVKLPYKELFYTGLHETWGNLLNKFFENNNNIINEINTLNKAVEKKLLNIFSVAEPVAFSYNLLSDLSEIINEMENIINDHENKTGRLSELKDAAQKRLLDDNLKKFIFEFDYLKKIKEMNDLDKLKMAGNIAFESQKSLVELKKEELDRLEMSLVDVSFAASKINSLLLNHFGHDNLELRTITSDSGHSYKLYRGNKVAKNLSDGEKSLIAFCYFIVQIEDMLKNPESQNKIVIYIDDPISSLDNGHIFFIFSLIEEKIMKERKYHQIFISTHNLDFLKYLKRISLKKINIGIEEVFEAPNYYLIQREQKSQDFCSKIIKMPNYMSEYTTEFHFLFKELIEFAKPLRRGSKQNQYENTYNTFYNVPNNLRKFLEYYMVQNFPNTTRVGVFKKLDVLFPQELAIKVNRVINEYSHLTYLDRGWKPLDIPELENCVLEVMKVIYFRDSSYFHELLSLIGETKFRPEEVFLRTLEGVSP